MEHLFEAGRLILGMVTEWENKLIELPDQIITSKRNEQGRSIKGILGHLVDSASNNTHRIIHLQYRPSPLEYPNYASNGNNDRWIAIQNYQGEDWQSLVRLWKHINVHLAHVMANVQEDALDNQWISAPGKTVSLRDMIIDYPKHMVWHLEEISGMAE